MNHPRNNRPPSPLSIPTPVVLRIMPKVGSSAPIGYIYDPDPSLDGGEGGLLAAAAAFFTQGHEVFWDPCPDLAAYRWAGRITSTIVDVDRLPDRILSAGLDLLDSFPPSSAGDSLGMSFMAEYLPVPPPPAVSRVDPVPLSPSFLGGSGGSIHSFRPAAQPFLHVPLRSVRSEDGRLQLDLEPQEHTPSRSGRVKPLSEHEGRLPARGSLSPLSIPSSVGYGGRHDGGGGPFTSYPPRSVGGPPPRSPPLSEAYSSPTRSEIFNGGGSDSSGIDPESNKNSSFWGSSSSDSAVDCPSQARRASLASPTSGVAPPPGPIPLPTVAPFTFPAIKNATNYFQTRELILYWLRRPGYSTARSDSVPIMDSRNALASQFWESQIRTALKDGGGARFLFENTGTTFYDKGFEMLQVLEDHYRPSSISNTFTTLLSLFNDTQSDAEGLHEFRSRFEGNLLVLSHSSVTIPQILQVMFFLRAIHPRYEGLLNQFASKHKDLSTASIDSILSDVKYMDGFIPVGAKGKPALTPSTPRSPFSYGGDGCC